MQGGGSAVADPLVSHSTDEDLVLFSNGGGACDALADVCSGESLINVKNDLKTGHSVSETRGPVGADPSADDEPLPADQPGAGVFSDDNDSGGGGDFGETGSSSDSETAANPRERLRAALRSIIDRQAASWTAEQRRDYIKGFADGFVAGLTGTLDLIKSAPGLLLDVITGPVKAQVGAARAVTKAAGWFPAVVGDEIASWWYGIPPQVLSQGIDEVRSGVRAARKIGRTAQQAGRIAADVSAIGYEMLKIFVEAGNNPFHPGSFASDDAGAIDQVLDQAGPLTVVLLNLVADAVADLGPHEQGYVMGLVTEQVVEWAVVTVVTDGAGADRGRRVGGPRGQAS